MTAYYFKTFPKKRLFLNFSVRILNFGVNRLIFVRFYDILKIVQIVQIDEYERKI